MHAVDKDVFIHNHGSANSAPIEVQQLIINKSMYYADMLPRVAKFVLDVNQAHVQNTNER
jgi:hypothetical protein